MNSARPENTNSLVSLYKAAQTLGVTVDVLLSWNEHEILKPTFTTTGEIVYTQDQIDKFLQIQQSLLGEESPEKVEPQRVAGRAERYEERRVGT